MLRAMAPKARGTKPRASAAQVSRKREQVRETMDKVYEAEDELQRKFDIYEIVQALEEDPRKIARCKRAVLGDDLLDVPEENDRRLYFCRTYIYFHKMPKDDVKACLKKLNPQTLSQSLLTDMNKMDRKVCHKIMYFVCQVEAGFHMPGRKKDLVFSFMAKRHASFGNLATKLALEGTKVNWAKCGNYLLTPQMAEEEEQDTAATRKYTHIKFVPLDVEATPHLHPSLCRSTNPWVPKSPGQGPRQHDTRA